jgi:ABC-type multidrug transport system fused ATPase/permease subunit
LEVGRRHCWCRRQWRSILAGIAYDTIWLVGLALTPWAIGHVVDDGLVPRDRQAFAAWLAVVIWLQLQHSLVQGLRDRAGILNWRRGYSRTLQVLARTLARNGSATGRGLHQGSVMTMASSDAFSIAFVPIMIGSILSSLAVYVLVGALLLSNSRLLGLLVLIGVPAFAALQFLLLKPLSLRQSAYRAAVERMNTVATDSVRGLRVLRGIGGEGSFVRRYHERSAETKQAGIGMAWPVAATEALKVLIAGVLVVGLTWLGAALVVQGRLTVGELVAFYGYAGFMVLPVSLVAQAVSTVAAATVGARRISGLLAVEPIVRSGDTQPDDADPLVEDGASGIRVGRQEHLGMVPPGEAIVIADRLARYVPDDPGLPVLVGGRAAQSLSLDALRRRVVVSDAVPFLFSGTLRTVLDPHDQHDDASIRRALDAADAMEVLEAAELGLDAEVPERGIQFSGGQRQRIGLARALLADAALLVLIEPTASVDAATEARMARGIAAFRVGRATVSASTSAPVLAHAERVLVLDGGRVRIEGRHRDLIDDDASYRADVLRGEGLR